MTPTARQRIAADRVLVIAHRGDSRQAPENTLPAFESAQRLGVDFVELDYLHTADDVPVVFHDECLDRTTDACRIWGGERIALAGKSSSDLGRLDAGAWFDPKFSGTRVSTLAAVLAALPQAMFMIERKSGSAEVLVRVLDEAEAIDRVVVHAFDWQFLADCRRLRPALAIGALGEKEIKEDRIDEARSLGADVLGWEAGYYSAEAIAWVHRAGMKAWAWTVDEPDLAQRLVSWGLDGLISNVPGPMQRLVASTR